MGLLNRQVERKLSALLGTEVTIERLNLSPLRGVLETSGMSVAGEDASQPLLTVRRVRAEVSIAKALRKQISVRSLVIEGPELRLERRSDGTTNIPRRRVDPSSDEDVAAPANDQTQPPESSSEDADAMPVDAKWELGVEEVRLNDGAVRLRLGDKGAYQIAVERIVVELKQGRDELTFTALGELSCKDGASNAALGEIRASGRFPGVSNLAALGSAGLDVQVELADLLMGTVRSDRLSSGHLAVEIRGQLDLSRLAGLLPSDLPSAIGAMAKAGGTLEIDMAARLSRESGVEIERCVLKASGLKIRT